MTTSERESLQEGEEGGNWCYKKTGSDQTSEHIPLEVRDMFNIGSSPCRGRNKMLQLKHKENVYLRVRECVCVCVVQN